MPSIKRLLATQWWFPLLAVTYFYLSIASAQAQQVLACYTLHNDLANFDRRAHSVDHYLMPELARGIHSHNPGALKRAYDRSYLGGSDIVRLRLINEMRRFGCPIPPRDQALLDGHYRRYHARKMLLPIDK